MQKPLTINEIQNKMERFCAYQERCHEEVVSKMKSLGLKHSEIDEIMVRLIDGNFLNEERFARAFARGKHRIKHWGKTRIVNELKARNISQYNINAALTEIEPEEYDAAFLALSKKHWDSLPKANTMAKRKKFCDFLLRKGYESDLVYARMKELERSES